MMNQKIERVVKNDEPRTVSNEPRKANARPV